MYRPDAGLQDEFIDAHVRGGADLGGAELHRTWADISNSLHTIAGRCVSDERAGLTGERSDRDEATCARRLATWLPGRAPPYRPPRVVLNAHGSPPQLSEASGSWRLRSGQARVRSAELLNTGDSKFC